MNEARFLIIGAAHWHAPWHLRALEAAGMRVVAIVDPAPAARSALGAGRAVREYVDVDQALTRHPEAIPIVLTPPREAPAVLERIIEGGRPFVLEKPGTVDAGALAAIVDAVAARRIATAVPFVNRYADFWAELRALGSIKDDWTHAHFRILAGPPGRYVRDGVPWVLSRRDYGGGALRNLGIHAADAVSQLTGSADVSVRSARTSNRLHGLEVEDFAIATLETTDARTITIEAGYAMPAENAADKEWRVHGPGWAVSESNGTVTIRDDQGPRSYAGAPSSEQYLAFGRTLADFAATGRSLAGDVHDLLRAQRIVDHIYAASRGDEKANE